MARAGFLDTGVLIGYCYTVDQHHQPCKSYLNQDSILPFTSETVTDEYENAKSNASTRYADAVRLHIEDVKRSDLEGELGPMDINRLQNKILDRRNELHRGLSEFYDNLQQFIQYDELLRKLEHLQRDIETLAIQRKEEIDERVDVWVPKEEHSDVRSQLDIHEPDLTICVEGHDLAVHLADDTELATANPTDFIYDGKYDEILDATEYGDIVNLTG